MAVRMEHVDEGRRAHGGYPPLYLPELNHVENLWGYMRRHYLSNRAYGGYGHLVAAAGDAYRALTPDMLKSVCRYDYAERAS